MASIATDTGAAAKGPEAEPAADDAAGQELALEITGGQGVRPYRPIPNSIDDLLDNLEAAYPPRSISALPTAPPRARSASTPRHNVLTLVAPQ